MTDWGVQKEAPILQCGTSLGGPYSTVRYFPGRPLFYNTILSWASGLSCLCCAVQGDQGLMYTKQTHIELHSSLSKKYSKHFSRVTKD